MSAPHKQNRKAGSRLAILNRGGIAGLVVLDLEANEIVNGCNAFWRTGLDLDAGAIRQRVMCRPCRGSWVLLGSLPGAHAPGYAVSPLRGWAGSRGRLPHARKTGRTGMS